MGNYDTRSIEKVLKNCVPAIFQLRSFYCVKTPAKALKTPPSVAASREL
jgi:hypothetical protein